MVRNHTLSLDFSENLLEQDGNLAERAHDQETIDQKVVFFYILRQQLASIGFEEKIHIQKC
jgi:hypothetical protein